MICMLSVSGGILERYNSTIYMPVIRILLFNLVLHTIDYLRHIMYLLEIQDCRQYLLSYHRAKLTTTTLWLSV
jgi:hypothetical protein